MVDCLRFSHGCLLQAASCDFACSLALGRFDPRHADGADELDELGQRRDREVLMLPRAEMADVVCWQTQEVASPKRVSQLAQERRLRGIVVALVRRLFKRCQELARARVLAQATSRGSRLCSAAFTRVT